MMSLNYPPPTADELALEELWEEHMVVTGREQRLAADRKQIERGNAGSTKGHRLVISSLIEPLSNLIREEIDRLSEGRVKRKPPELASLQLLPAPALATITLRSVVDFIGQYGEESATIQRLGGRIGRITAAEVVARNLRKEERALFEARVAQITARTSSTTDRIKQILKAARQVAERYEGDPDAPDMLADEVLTVEEQTRLGAFMVSALVTLGFLREEIFSEGKTRKKRYYAFSEEAAQALLKAGEAASMLRPMYMPTIIPPKPWVSMNEGGYWRKGRMSRLVLRRGATNGVREADSEAMPRMFASLNFLQNTPWRINKRVLAVVETMRKNNIAKAGLPPSELLPIPPQPHDIDDNEVSRKAWRTAARKVNEANARIRSNSLACAKTILTAQDMAEYEQFWFPKVIDFRGRVYDLPLFLKPQGDDLSKGLLEFANGKPLGEDGGYWLAVHGANVYGEDKLPLDDRVQWVIQNEETILRAAEDPFEERFWMDADKPLQFLAFCFEWAGAREHGDDFVSHLPVAMDGSCNGLQHLSAILRDPVGGAAVNLLPADRPSDIYTEVMKVVVKELEHRVTLGEPTAALWLPVMKRSVVKRPVMTLPYGATRQGFADQIVEDTIRTLEQAGQSPFGPGGPLAAQYLSHIVWAATGQVVVAARVAMDWLQEVAKVASSANLPLEWTTPTGFKVRQDYRNDKERLIELLAVGQRIQMRVAVGKEDQINKRRMASAIAPNFVHSLDAGHMLRTVEYLLDRGRDDMHLAMVHDSYATHAADSEALAHALRRAFVEMYNEKCWLTAFRDEVAAQLPAEFAEKLPPVPAQGNLHLSDVLNSLYFFA